MVNKRLFFISSLPGLFIRKKNACSYVFYVFQVGDTVIGTHFIDLSTISHDGDKGEKHTFSSICYKMLNLFKDTCQPLVQHLYTSTGQPETTA